MNPRYVAYAAAHGRTADEMLAHDRERHPGGHMGGFMRWIGERWSRWDKARGQDRRTHCRTAEEHAAFDAELAAEFGGQS